LKWYHVSLTDERQPLRRTPWITKSWQFSFDYSIKFEPNKVSFAPF